MVGKLKGFFISFFIYSTVWDTERRKDLEVLEIEGFLH